MVRGALCTPFVMGLSTACWAADGVAGSPLDARGPLILGIILGITAFAITAAIGFLRATRRARAAETKAEHGAKQIGAELDGVRTILSSEPQILVHWERGGEGRIVTNSLDEDLLIPNEIKPLLNFSGWLEDHFAGDLTEKLEALKSEAKPFSVMAATVAGAHVELEGRATSAGAILKIRDLVGERESLSKICERHEALSSRIEATRSFLDALPMPVWLRDAEGRIEWVNRAYAGAVEAADGEEVRRRQLELVEASMRGEAEQRIAEGEIYSGRFDVPVQGGTRSFDMVMAPLGQASAGIAVNFETADLAMASPYVAHDRTLDRIGTAVAVFTGEQRLSYFNRAYLDLWRLDEEWLASGPAHGEILDRLRQQGRLPEQTDFREWRERQVAPRGEDQPQDDWWHLPDGRSIRVLADRAADGGLTFLYEDGTERLALESRFNALIQVQKETLDNLQEGVAVFASDGRLKLFNRSFARIWQLGTKPLAREPHIDDVIEQCRMLLDDDAAWDEVKSAVTGIDHERRSLQGELARPDGSVLAYAGLPLPDGATLLTYVDITDTKRAERALIERNEALEAADRLKSEFISKISYELRVPLTNIIGFSELLAMPAMGPLSEKQRDYVSHVRSSSDTLLAIINDILDLASIDAGALELKITKVELGDVLKAAVLGVRERLQQAKLDLKVQIGEPVEAFDGDAQRVTQVIYNLLVNAIDFSPEGGIVRLDCRRVENMMAISVTDQGPGIPEELQEAVFQRFEGRAGNSKQRGVGLGLSIVKSLVELHGGDAAFVSAPGHGTTVTVRFPVSHAAAKPGGAGGSEPGREATAKAIDDRSPAAA
jgi:signal transduction histidine kinase